MKKQCRVAFGKYSFDLFEMRQNHRKSNIGSAHKTVNAATNFAVIIKIMKIQKVTPGFY